MDILERYISAYVVECLTGITGDNPDYYSILAQSISKTQHPLLKQVLEITHGNEPRDEAVKERVRKLSLAYLQTRYPGLLE